MHQLSNMKKILLIIFIFALFMFSLLSLRRFSNNQIESNKLQITASFYPMYFFASQIGGDKVNVINITPAGAEPHDYDPTPQDIIKIQESKLLILNGKIEPWGNKIQSDLKNSNTQIIIAGENLGIPTDPHLWLSPNLAKIESQKIETALSKIDPQNSDFYKTNLANLESELDKIDASYKKGFLSCQTKSFVTSHAAFGY